MEYCELGSASTFLKKNFSEISNVDLTWMCVHIARGMSYLHSKNPVILHNDLAARNILLDKSDGKEGKFLAKVSDFGLANIVDSTPTRNDTELVIPVRYV